MTSCLYSLMITSSSHDYTRIHVAIIVSTILVPIRLLSQQDRVKNGLLSVDINREVRGIRRRGEEHRKQHELCELQELFELYGLHWYVSDFLYFSYWENVLFRSYG